VISTATSAIGSMMFLVEFLHSLGHTIHGCVNISQLKPIELSYISNLK
jgi:hypothetical protein